MLSLIGREADRGEADRGGDCGTGTTRWAALMGIAYFLICDLDLDLLPANVFSFSRYFGRTRVVCVVLGGRTWRLPEQPGNIILHSAHTRDTLAHTHSTHTI